MAVVVEFAGAPCSGKTTAFRAGKTYFQERGFINGENWLRRYISDAPLIGCMHRRRIAPNIASATLLLWAHLRQGLSTPQLYWRLCCEIAHSSRRLKTARSVFFKLGKGILIRRYCTQDVYLDEGVVQMLFAVFVPPSDKAPRLHRIESILKVLPLPQTVLFGPDLPESELVRRILTRGHHRVTGKRHSRHTLSEPAFGDVVAKRAAERLITNSNKIQRALIGELSHVIEVRRFNEHGLV